MRCITVRGGRSPVASDGGRFGAIDRIRLKELVASETNYSQLDKEGLSLVCGVTKFHQYLYGMTFLLITNHRPVLGLFNEQRPIPAKALARLQRWTFTLSGYDYIIRHRS